MKKKKYYDNYDSESGSPKVKLENISILQVTSLPVLIFRNIDNQLELIENQHEYLSECNIKEYKLSTPYKLNIVKTNMLGIPKYTSCEGDIRSVLYDYYFNSVDREMNTDDIIFVKKLYGNIYELNLRSKSVIVDGNIFDKRFIAPNNKTKYIHTKKYIRLEKYSKLFKLIMLCESDLSSDFNKDSILNKIHINDLLIIAINFQGVLNISIINIVNKLIYGYIEKMMKEISLMKSMILYKFMDNKMILTNMGLTREFDIREISFGKKNNDSIILKLLNLVGNSLKCINNNEFLITDNIVVNKTEIIDDVEKILSMNMRCAKIKNIPIFGKYKTYSKSLSNYYSFLKIISTHNYLISNNIKLLRDHKLDPDLLFQYIIYYNSYDIFDTFYQMGLFGSI